MVLQNFDFMNHLQICRLGQDDMYVDRWHNYTVFCCSEWSQLSIGVLSECYSTHERKAQDLLVRELVHWGEATCMLIAVKADNKQFISQTACQSLLNTIWMGKMMQENGTWRVKLT